MIPDRKTFHKLCNEGNVIALHQRVMSDQLTPVLGYRRLVASDDRTAPSFLLESVEGGASVGRHSFIGAQPIVEVVAHENDVTVTDHRSAQSKTTTVADPLFVPRNITSNWKVAPQLIGKSLAGFTGGWVGYAGYDTVRYMESEKLPFESAPPDDRQLPDLHFALYPQVAVFDHVDKVLYAISHVVVDDFESIDAAYESGCKNLEEFVSRLETHSVPLPAGSINLDLSERPCVNMSANCSRESFESVVEQCKNYIAAGDIYQVVVSQRFERTTSADPFEIYRALRIVNPSPYMIYLQAKGSILVASSPEILCRCEDRVVINRPLAGTRPRGVNQGEDAELERELIADQKERAEHVMLVDLGRNDLGRVCETASVKLDRVMEVERYSHVMHLSSTVTGHLKEELDCWDALRGTLPVGTVSGAPKVRAMQIIDEVEPTRRGPYAGGIGVVGLRGDMDVALALRTMVIPTSDQSSNSKEWRVHIQAGAGIVADSIPSREYEETVNKAAALGRAIDLAEDAFGRDAT